MQDQLSLKFAALADPTRRAMLASLAKRGECTVSEIAAPFLKNMSLPAATKHLKVLEHAGLVTKTHDAQRRMCNVNLEGFKDAADFLEQYRKGWEESFDRLGAYLQTVTAKKKKSKRKKSHGRKK